MQGMSLNLRSALLWNIKTHVRMIDWSVRSTVCWCCEGWRSLFHHEEKKPHTFWQKNLKLVEFFSHALQSASVSVKSWLLLCSQQLISYILGILCYQLVLSFQRGLFQSSSQRGGGSPAGSLKSSVPVSLCMQSIVNAPRMSCCTMHEQMDDVTGQRVL